jgi:Ca-activated chloride channel family protein
MVMEQLLDQVEGNPSYLMRNQFMLEEQRMNEDGGRLYEPRPW